ncbi:UvrD-helicase domain-containing protein [Streptacidiphilus pinicola]|uniref:UvrD-helicase domain-containing protein n=1 Tax=Streptacidiphilus pinicola TaxID=2219663 RepID=UPI001FB21961|nr:UvrD-helicase domain-containing protein [Streptacidiphilus pinicola]
MIAAAGSRKTQQIVDSVLSDPSERVLVTTYTTENLGQLVGRLSAGSGILPAHVTAMGWFTFLLNECARPYQSAVLGDVGVIRGLDFVGQRFKFAKRSEPQKYYMDRHKDMFRDGLSDFTVQANRATNGLVIDRLAGMYDHIYIDEVQDLAGHDLELLDLLFKSPIGVTVVGDPRQATYATNNSKKNKRYKGGGVVDWLAERDDRCLIDVRDVSFRCNQEICDFADGLYPDLDPTVSKNAEVTGHDGIFEIKRDEVHDYVQRHAPMVLRYDKRADTLGLDAMNIGLSKGSTFDRVLIFPTKPMLKYLGSRNPDEAGAREKLYVAVTRAKYSVAFVVP